MRISPVTYGVKGTIAIAAWRLRITCVSADTSNCLFLLGY